MNNEEKFGKVCMKSRNMCVMTSSVGSPLVVAWRPLPPQRPFVLVLAWNCGRWMS